MLLSTLLNANDKPFIVCFLQQAVLPPTGAHTNRKFTLYFYSSQTKREIYSRRGTMLNIFLIPVEIRITTMMTMIIIIIIAVHDYPNN